MGIAAASRFRASIPLSASSILINGNRVASSALKLWRVRRWSSTMSMRKASAIAVLFHVLPSLGMTMIDYEYEASGLVLDSHRRKVAYSQHEKGSRHHFRYLPSMSCAARFIVTEP